MFKQKAHMYGMLAPARLACGLWAAYTATARSTPASLRQMDASMLAAHVCKARAGGPKT